MARQAKAKTQKGSNGTGDTLTVYFDRSDPAERKALEAARLLAAKHGRRKQAIIALLEAIYSHYEATGELLSASEISAGLSGGTVLIPNANTAQRSGESNSQPKSPRKRQHTSRVEVTNSGKASTRKVADNFLASMKGLATGFFD